MRKPNTYSVVVPVFNSHESLKELVKKLFSVFTEREILHEIILIDDGSPDPSTWNTIDQLSRDYEEVIGIQLTRNFGRQGALVCGLEASTGNYVIIIDDDLQHDPNDIPALIKQNKHDVVIARFNKKSHHFGKQLLSRVNEQVQRVVLKKPAGIIDSSFKMVKRHVIDHVCRLKSSQPYLFASLCFVTRDMVNVDLDHSPRKYGKSGFTVSKMWQSFSNLVFNNSSILLRVIAIFGLIIAVLSLGYGGYVLVQKLIGNVKVLGWASIVIMVSTFGGLTLFTLGIMGEYLIRIIKGIENRPAYLVRSKTDEEDS